MTTDELLQGSSPFEGAGIYLHNIVARIPYDEEILSKPLDEKMQWYRDRFFAAIGETIEAHINHAVLRDLKERKESGEYSFLIEVLRK